MALLTGVDCIILYKFRYSNCANSVPARLAANNQKLHAQRRRHMTYEYTQPLEQKLAPQVLNELRMICGLNRNTPIAYVCIPIPGVQYMYLYRTSDRMWARNYYSSSSTKGLFSSHYMGTRLAPPPPFGDPRPLYNKVYSPLPTSKIPASAPVCSYAAWASLY